MRQWLQNWQLRTWINDHLCYLIINCDTGQHLQFLRCLASLSDGWLADKYCRLLFVVLSITTLAKSFFNFSLRPQRQWGIFKGSHKKGKRDFVPTSIFLALKVKCNWKTKLPVFFQLQPHKPAHLTIRLVIFLKLIVTV